MQTTAIRNDVSWKDLGSWVDAYDDGYPSSEISIQDLRERMERVFDWSENAEIQMRTPHIVLDGETPWDVLYCTATGPRRIETVLDLLEQGKLRIYRCAESFSGPEQRAV